MRDGIQARELQVVIIDYQMGNLRSVRNAFDFLGYNATISGRASDILDADVLVLPGVGAFGVAMTNLNSQGLIAPMSRKVLDEGTPFLGICLGMQLIAESSEEKGRNEGLGWIPGAVQRIKDAESLRVPHVGWNATLVKKRESLFANFDHDPDFYYVHSYHLLCPDDLVLAHCQYGDTLIAAVQRANIQAVQFHPEKSQVNGLRVLRNFMNTALASVVNG